MTEIRGTAALSVVEAEAAGTPAPALPNNTKIAMHGDYAVGKTHQLGLLIQAVGKENVAIVSCDQGLATIASLVEPANVFVPTNTTDLRRAWAWAKKFNRPDAYVCIDGASRAMYWMFDELLTPVERVFEMVVGKKTIDAANHKYLRFLSAQEKIDIIKVYGEHGKDERLFWNEWAKMDWNLVATFLSKETKHSGYTSLPPYGPDVPGKMGIDAILGTFDLVLALDRDANRKVVAQTFTDNQWLARVRVDRFNGVSVEDRIVDFNLADFLAYIKNGRKA